MNEWMSSRANVLSIVRVERTNEWMKRMKRMNEWSNWHCSFAHIVHLHTRHYYTCIMMYAFYSRMKWVNHILKWNEWMNEWMNEWNVALRVWMNVAKEILPRNQITSRTTARTVDCLHQHNNNIRDVSWRNRSVTLRPLWQQTWIQFLFIHLAALRLTY